MRNRIAMIVVLMALGACIFPTDTCACTLAPPLVIVHGTVETATGSPAAGAVVDVRILNRTCSGIVSSGNVLAGNTGAYRTDLLAPAGTDSACVDVVARGVSSDSAVVRGAKVRISAPPDSVRVDLQLP